MRRYAAMLAAGLLVWSGTARAGDQSAYAQMRAVMEQEERAAALRREALDAERTMRRTIETYEAARAEAGDPITRRQIQARIDALEIKILKADGDAWDAIPKMTVAEQMRNRQTMNAGSTALRTSLDALLTTVENDEVRLGTAAPAERAAIALRIGRNAAEIGQLAGILERARIIAEKDVVLQEPGKDRGILAPETAQLANQQVKLKEFTDDQARLDRAILALEGLADPASVIGLARQSNDIEGQIGRISSMIEFMQMIARGRTGTGTAAETAIMKLADAAVAHAAAEPIMPRFMTRPPATVIDPFTTPFPGTNRGTRFFLQAPAITTHPELTPRIAEQMIAMPVPTLRIRSGTGPGTPRAALPARPLRLR